MKNKLTTTLRLEIIEGLCLLFHDTDMSIETAEKIIDDIYIVAHPKTRCPHPDWDKKTVDTLKALKKNLII